MPPIGGWVELDELDCDCFGGTEGKFNALALACAGLASAGKLAACSLAAAFNLAPIPSGKSDRRLAGAFCFATPVITVAASGEAATLGGATTLGGAAALGGAATLGGATTLPNRLSYAKKNISVKHK